MKSLTAIDRELKSLDALEKRVRQTVNPSQILLRDIAKQREALLNPKENDASTQTQAGKQEPLRKEIQK